jgi:hypothetical protein
MNERRLISIRRSVPAARTDEYDAAWHRLNGEVVSRAAHAWRFHSAATGDLRLEFIEFEAGADPRGYAPVSAALQRLERASPASAIEEWISDA